MKKSIHLGLLPRILIAILLGILLGLFLPKSAVRLFVTFNSIFSNLLQFMIPLIIIGLVTPAISDIGKSAGKLLLITVAIAYCDTVFAGLLSYGTSVSVFPKLIGGKAAAAVSEFENLEPYFTIQIPPMVDVMSSLIFSFILGLGMAFFGSPSMKAFADEFKDIVVKMIEVTNKFDYFGLFSAGLHLAKGGYQDSFADQIKANPEFATQSAKLFGSKPKLYWMGMGKTDFLYQSTVDLRAYWDSKGYKYEYVETDGGHIWRNWRIYLTMFAQKIFK